MANTGYRGSDRWVGQWGRVFHRRLRVTTTGSAGSATGAAYVSLPGCRLTHIKADFHASAPATTDTLVKINGLSDGTTGTTVITMTNRNTDLAISPVGQPNAVDEARNTTGTAGAYTDGLEGGAFIKNGLSVSLAQCDALTDALILDCWFERLRYEVVTLISQTGADGSGACTQLLNLQGAGVLIGVEVDFQNQPATTDLVIKADSTTGDTLFTSTNSNTDFGPSALGTVAIDEGLAATAATDGVAGGQPFRTGLFFDQAQADAFTSSNEKTLVHCWIRQ